MSEKVDNVERAIRTKLFGFVETLDVAIAAAIREAAVAAIEAMREPTDSMCEAGAVYYHDNYQEGHAKEQTTAPDIWRAMIDAALKESSLAFRS